MNPGSVYCFSDSPFRKKLFSPLKSNGFVPEKHSELFVGGIPPMATVHDLKNFFEKVGEIYEIKLMTRDDQVHNRGFAYVTFMNSAIAQKALKTLKTELFMDTTFLTLCESVDNCRIFVGGLPVEKSKDQIWNELKNVYDVKNIVDVITYRSYANPAHNRGFVFLEFRTHEEASYFRAKYWDKLSLFGKQLKVCWAIPNKDSFEEDKLEQVKILFLRNLNVTQTIEEFTSFIHHFIEEQFIEKIYKFKNYAYLHIKTRTHAEELLEKLKAFYQGSLVEVSFSTPPSKFTNKNFRQNLLANISNSTVGCSREPLRSIENNSSMELLQQLANKNKECEATATALKNIYIERIALHHKLLSANVPVEELRRPLCEQIAEIPARLGACSPLPSASLATCSQLSSSRLGAYSPIPLPPGEHSRSEGILFNNAEFEEMFKNLKDM